MIQKIRGFFRNWKWTPARAGFIIGVCILLGYFYYSLTGFCAG